MSCPKASSFAASLRRRWGVGVSRRTRSTAVLLAGCVLASGLVLVSTASAAEPVVNLSAHPQPPKKVQLSWAAYSDFPVDHYQVTISPGFRSRETSSTTILFTDLNWGVTYTASIQAFGTGGEQSPESTLTLPGAKLTAGVSNQSVLRGKRVAINGWLKSTSGAPLANRQLELQVDVAPRNGKYSVESRLRTSDTGHYRGKVTAKRNSTVRVLYARTDTAGGWAYEQIKVRIHVLARGPDRVVPVGDRFQIKGAVHAPDQLVRGKGVQLQKLSKSRNWRTVKKSKLSAEGRCSFSVTPSRRGDSFWRLRTAPTKYFTTSVARSLKVTVR